MAERPNYDERLAKVETSLDFISKTLVSLEKKIDNSLWLSMKVNDQANQIKNLESDVSAMRKAWRRIIMVVVGWVILLVLKNNIPWFWW